MNFGTIIVHHSHPCVFDCELKYVTEKAAVQL